jgi:hypothetical protein
LSGSGSYLRFSFPMFQALRPKSLTKNEFISLNANSHRKTLKKSPETGMFCFSVASATLEVILPRDVFRLSVVSALHRILLRRIPEIYPALEEFI